MSDADAPAPEPEEERGLEPHLRIYLRDESLWPVLFAALAIAVSLGAAVCVAATALGNPFARLALALLALISLDVLQRDLRRRRLGLVSRSLLVWWALSACVAALVVRAGWV